MKHLTQRAVERLRRHAGANPGAARGGAFCLLALLAAPALAHPLASGIAGAGFAAGFAHPFSGADHLLAMLGVGIWGGQQRAGRAQALAFPLMMLAGALSGVAGLTLPGLETGLAATVALAGLVVALALALPGWLALTMVSLFALAHGNAHGHELPQAQAAAGFLAASALLLGAGRAVGRLGAAVPVRLAGLAIAASGIAMLGLG
jgi:urease accessory protein